MKKILLIWSVAALLIVTAIVVTHTYSLNEDSKEPSSSTLPETGSVKLEKAVDFRLEDLDGNPISLQDLRGKNVYLNFWATWCKWCKKEMPDMKKIYDQYKGQNIVMLTVNVGEKQETAKTYMTDNQYPFQVLLDSDKSVTRAYEIRSIPVSLFLDKEGNIVHKRVGAMNEEQMQTVIKELLE